MRATLCERFSMISSCSGVATVTLMKGPSRGGTGGNGGRGQVTLTQRRSIGPGVPVPLDPVPDADADPRLLEQPILQVTLRGECSQGESDGEVVVAALDDVDRIAGRELTLLEHPQIGARDPVLDESADPLGLADEALEHRAGNADPTDLEQHRADAPAVPEPRALHVEPDGGEVLAELAGPQRPAELERPDVEVLTGIGVDGLVRAAVVVVVADLVVADAQPVHANRSGHGVLVDGGPLLAAPRDLDGGAGVHRLDTAHEADPVSPVDSAAMKASWGTSTRPTIFIRFLPSFCFSSSLRLRLMSPP